MYFDDFQSRMKRGDEPRLVLFFGEAEGVLAEGLQSVREAFLRKDKGGNVRSYKGGEGQWGDLLAAARTSSLFSQSQLLILHQAEKALGGRGEEALQALKDYCADPNPDTRMVLLAPGMKKTSKAVALVEKLGWAVQCSELPEWKLAPWISEQAKSRGLSMREDAVQALVQKAGPDMAYLQGALDQLVLYIHPRKSATAEEVRELPIPGTESDIFPFLDAAASRQGERALRMLSRLTEGVDAGTLTLLYMRLRELLGISAGRAKGWGQSQVAENLGLHPFRLKNLWDQSSQFTPAELREALLDVIHAQAGMVTGRTGKGVPAVMLECWILKWGRRGTAAGKAAAL